MSPLDNQLKVWMSKYGWSADESGQIFICSQEESIKPKNIVEKIDFDSKWPRAMDWGAAVPSSEQAGVCRVLGGTFLLRLHLHPGRTSEGCWVAFPVSGSF